MIEHSRLTLWSTATWNEAGRLDGTWLDGAISRDGKAVVAVDLAGDLHLASTEDGLATPARVTPPDPVRAVALGEDRIVAAFAGGEPVRTARLELP